jgi:hypothetical protein
MGKPNLPMVMPHRRTSSADILENSTGSTISHQHIPCPPLAMAGLPGVCWTVVGCGPAGSVLVCWMEHALSRANAPVTRRKVRNIRFSLHGDHLAIGEETGDHAG